MYARACPQRSGAARAPAWRAPDPPGCAAALRSYQEFKDVAFEDVLFDNDSFVTFRIEGTHPQLLHP